MDSSTLTDALQRADTRAQRWLYDTYAPVLYAICLRYMPDEARAQDCLQEAFITIYRKVGELREAAALEGWMRRITVNTCLMALRKDGRRDLGLDNLGVDEPVALDADAVSAMSADELFTTVRQLPDGLREVFNLFAIEGHPHSEIATMLGISESNSKVRLNRARSILKEKLERMGVTANSR